MMATLDGLGPLLPQTLIGLACDDMFSFLGGLFKVETKPGIELIED